MAVPVILSSVPAQTPYVQYIASASQTVFSYPFEITQDSDLVCLINGVAQPTDGGYTLSGQGNTTGGFLTFTVGQAAGTIVTLYRNVTIARITQLSQNGTFFSANFNNEFNRIYLIMQQLQQSLLPGGNQAYALMVPNSNNPAPTTLLTPAAYANKYLSFDANGNPTPAVLTSSGTLTASIISGLTGAQTAAETAAGATVVNTAYPVGNVVRYGADPTGVNSSYTAFKNAIALCTGTGLPVTIPAGVFNLPTSNPALNAAYVTFQGTGVSDGGAIATAGSVLSFTGTTLTNSAFVIGAGVTFNGVGFYYPAQTNANCVANSGPYAFAPTIVTNTALSSDSAINFVYIQNCTVWNAYRFFVDTDATGALGHIFILDNTIYGVLTCFEIAYNSEIVTFQGNEFSFGHYENASSEASTGLRYYTRNNGTVLKMPRTDGITFNSNVLYGYQYGIHFNTSATLCQLTSITANYFDTVLFPILADGTGNISGVMISANSFLAFNPQLTSSIGNAIKITTSGSAAQELVTVTGNNFSTCTGDEILVSGGTPTRTLTFVGNQFGAMGQYQTTGSYAGLNISGAATSYIATGNTFVNEATTPGVANGILGTAVDNVITGNIFVGLQTAINITANTSVVTGNQSAGTLATYANNYAYLATTVDLGNTWDKDSVTTTGFGIPTAGLLTANFPGSSATLAQCGGMLSELIAILKIRQIVKA